MSKIFETKTHVSSELKDKPARHPRFAAGSDTVCTSLFNSLRIVFEATPVVALLKCCLVRRSRVWWSVRRLKRPHATRTMLDTPLVRGERARISVGVAILAMMDE